MTFESSDWVWMHKWKEHFLAQRRSKLHPKGDNAKFLKRLMMMHSNWTFMVSIMCLQ